MTAEYKVHGAVAVITLNNPPVNGLGLSTRRAVIEGLNQANADAAVQAIVITGAGKAFSGELRAESQAEVNATLRKQGLTVVKLKKRRGARGKKITQKDIAYFTRQLSTMLKAGIPL